MVVICIALPIICGLPVALIAAVRRGGTVINCCLHALRLPQTAHTLHHDYFKLRIIAQDLPRTGGRKAEDHGKRTSARKVPGRPASFRHSPRLPALLFLDINQSIIDSRHMEPFLVDESVDKIARALFDRWTRSPVIEFSENIEDAIFLEAATRGWAPPFPHAPPNQLNNLDVCPQREPDGESSGGYDIYGNNETTRGGGGVQGMASGACFPSSSRTLLGLVCFVRRAHVCMHTRVCGAVNMSVCEYFPVFASSCVISSVITTHTPTQTHPHA